MIHDVQTEDAVQRQDNAAMTGLRLKADEFCAAMAVSDIFPELHSPLLIELRHELKRTIAEDRQPQPRHFSTLTQHGLMLSQEPPQIRSDLRQALQTLADPAGELFLAFGGADTVGSHRYFTPNNQIAHDWVMFDAAEDETFLVSFFHSIAQVVGIAERHLGFRSIASSASPLEMSWPEFITLLAIVDAQQAAWLQSLLNRDTRIELLFEPDQIQSMLKQTRDAYDLRWKVPLLRLFCPWPVETEEQPLRATLQRMARAGILSDNDSGYQIGPAGEEFAQAMLSLVSFISVSRGSLREPEPQDDVHLLVLRTLNLLWKVRFRSSDSDNDVVVTVSPASGESIREELTRFANSSADHGSPATLPTCRQCGIELPKNAKFCFECGTAVSGSPAVMGGKS